MDRITLYSFLAKRNGRLVMDCKDDEGISDFEKLSSLLERIEFNKIFKLDAAGKIKYKLVSKYNQNNRYGILLLGGEKLEDVVDDRIEDIEGEFDPRKKHIYCFIYDNDKSEVYFNSFGGGKISGKNVKSIIDNILAQYESDVKNRIMQQWTFDAYASDEFLKDIRTPQNLSLTYIKDSIFDDKNDEMRQLKEVFDIKGVEEVFVKLKVGSAFPLKRVKKHLDEAVSTEGIKIAFNGVDKDGSVRHINSETAYKKIMVDIRDVSDINILNAVIENIF